MESSVIFSIVLAGITCAYFVLIIAFCLPLLRKPGSKDPDTGDHPFVTVIIPARNEASDIRRCLETIGAQDYPHDRFEVLVSDDFSEDETREISERFFRQNQALRARVIGAEGGPPMTGKKPALQRAIGEASGEWILATDADTDRGSGWISAMVRESKAKDCKMVLGPVILEGGSGFFPAIQILEFLGIMGITAGSAGLKIPVMCNGANLLYLKQAFEESGGFSTHRGYASGDDQFLLAAIRKRYGKHSVRFAMDRKAVVTTRPEIKISSFLNQRLRWVSKSTGYRDPAVILTGALTYLVHLGILAGCVAGIFSPAMLEATLLCWALKLVADLFPVAIMSEFFRKGKLLWLFLPAQAFQPVYIVITGILGLVLPYRWKGRLIRA